MLASCAAETYQVVGVCQLPVEPRVKVCEFPEIALPVKVVPNVNPDTVGAVTVTSLLPGFWATLTWKETTSPSGISI